MPPAVRDVYGFELDCTPEQLQIRARCDAKQEQQAAKWAKYEARQQQPPSGDKLKNLCRKAGLPHTLPCRMHPHLIQAVHARSLAGFTMHA